MKIHTAVTCYDRTAWRYDSSISYLAPIRERAINALSLKRGQVVLDVACGTGLSFAPLLEALRGEGQIVGIEENARMLEIAEQRIAGEGWNNITLVHSRAEDAKWAGMVDAVLFHFTHDVLQSPHALRNLFQYVKPGASVVSAGMKWSRPKWNPVNLYPYFGARSYIRSFDGFEKPWRELETFIEHPAIDPSKLGTIYLLKASRKARFPNLPTQGPGS